MFVCPALPPTRSPLLSSALGALWLPLVGCLSIDAVPTSDDSEDARVADAQPDSASDAGPAAHCADSVEDPLLGEWANEGGSVCSFFENGRYTSGCGVAHGHSGFADTWSRLKEGRYFFSTSSLGSPADAFSVQAMFNEDCSQVILTGGETALNLTRSGE